MRIFENLDCMIGMEKYKDILTSRKVLAIVDPPYGIGATCGWDIVKDSRPKHKKAVESGYQKYDISKVWDVSPPTKEYFNELFGVSKNQIIWGGNYFVENLPNSKGWIYWDKGNDYKESFNFSHGELAFTSFAKRLLSYSISPKAETKGGKERIHPTQKPIALYKWLLENYAKDHDLILDTHVGSASSLIACEGYGIDYIGFELDSDYYTAAKQRIEKARFERENKVADECYTKDLALFDNV